MQPAHDVTAILVSDIHLSHKPPVARSAEVCWYTAMQRPLVQLMKLANKYKCPTICGGDLFDKWNSPAELINFAMDHLPHPFYSVAGQHDLPLHNYDDIEKSAFWTLVKSTRIQVLDNTLVQTLDGISLHGFSWGSEVTPCPERHALDDSIHLAVIHAYVWQKGFGHPGASEDSQLKAWSGRLQGYDAVLFGDNHVPFQKGKVLNPGSFMRRKSDEINHKPCVGLLHRDGSITLEYLDCSEDKWIDPLGVLETASSESGLDLSGFLEELTGLADSDLNFADAVLKFMETKSVHEGVRRLLLNAIGQGK